MVDRNYFFLLSGKCVTRALGQDGRFLVETFSTAAKTCPGTEVGNVQTTAAV